MGIKATIKKSFSNDKKLLGERFVASKVSFVLSAFIFFVNYFLVSANIVYEEYLLQMLPLTYVTFIISSIFITFFSIKMKFYGKVPEVVFSVFFLVLLFVGVILSMALLLPDSMIPDIF